MMNIKKIIKRKDSMEIYDLGAKCLINHVLRS